MSTREKVSTPHLRPGCRSALSAAKVSCLDSGRPRHLHRSERTQGSLSTPSLARIVDLSNVNAGVSECSLADLVHYASLAVTNRSLSGVTKPHK
jgi:hypothetical protein